MQRLAALVPRPRLNLIRFHGVLAPNAKLRSSIIPGVQQNLNNVPDHSGDGARGSHSSRMSWAQLLTKPPGAVLNGSCRPEGRKPGRAFVNEYSISTSLTVPTALAP